MANTASFSYDDLIACGDGRLFGNDGPQLPLPPMLMFDEITEISDSGGQYGKGFIRAQLKIRPDLWFFPCHFKNDPVMPGCLGVDALWQLVGFFLGWIGGRGSGRALGVGEIKFNGMIRPSTTTVEYLIELKRVVSRRLCIGVADGTLLADGEPVYQATDLRVGLFSDAISEGESVAPAEERTEAHKISD